MSPITQFDATPCDVESCDGFSPSRNGEAAQNPAHFFPEVENLAALLAELPDDDRAELLASVRTLIKFYRAGVTAESK